MPSGLHVVVDLDKLLIFEHSSFHVFFFFPFSFHFFSFHFFFFFSFIYFPFFWCSNIFFLGHTLILEKNAAKSEVVFTHDTAPPKSTVQ